MHSRASRRQRSARPPAVSTVLAFDCAVSGLGIAVVRDGTCLARLYEEGRDQAARLLPAIGSALDQGAIERRELDLIAVTIGPGSFTGVRVGLAAARGLAVGLGIPLAGMATTSVLLTQASTTDRQVVAAVDSRLGDWFCAIGGGERPPFVTGAEQLVACLDGRPCLVVGHGLAPLASSLAAAGIDAMVCEALPDPVILGRLALATGVEAWRARNRREGLPRPLYLRGVNITLPDGARHTVE
jgi:tRNA threonylcarbamoyladenosine biosynthesis protein TsaB